MTMKKKVLSAIVACVAVVAMAFTAYATSINWNVNLPNWGGNAILIDSEKSKSSDHATNRIDFMGGDYDSMEVWMKVDGSKTYGKTEQYKGNNDYTMTMGGTKDKGTKVVVYGENASNTYVNVTARGYCNIF